MACRRVSLFPAGSYGSQWPPGLQLSIALADKPSASVLRLGDVGLALPFGIFGSCRSDLHKCFFVFAVHSVRPSDIKFVAAMGNVDTVSISRR